MRVKIPAHLAISFAVAILCSLVVLYATVPLYQSYIEKTAYPAYLETVETGPGSVGYDAAENTPHAASLADIQRHDNFALEVIHYESADVVEKQRYYNLTLPNGEVVIGHLSGDAHIQGIGTTESGDALYLLPVGRWNTLNLPAGYSGALSSESYADNTHFVECVGDEYPTIGEFALQQPGYQIASKLWIVVFIVVYIVCATILKRRKKARQAAQEK